MYTHLKVEVQDDDHLSITGLEDGVFDVVVQDVDFISTYRCEPEPYTHNTN